MPAAFFGLCNLTYGLNVNCRTPLQIRVGGEGLQPAFYALVTFIDVAAAEAAASALNGRSYRGTKSLSTRFVCFRAAANPPVSAACSFVCPNDLRKVVT